jgi:hypothetical protein
MSRDVIEPVEVTLIDMLATFVQLPCPNMWCGLVSRHVVLSVLPE